MNFDPESGARMGLLTFANDAEVKYHLNDYATGDEAYNAISFKYSGKNTNFLNHLLGLNK